MSVPMDIARRVADAVLYEGHLLYPYRASAAKNQVRWQFGVLVPPGFTATAEHPASVTECLLEGASYAVAHLNLRFLHVRTRGVERAEDDGYWPVQQLRNGHRTYLTFDEATEREAEVTLPIAGLIDAPERVIEVRVPGDRVVEPIVAPSGEVIGRLVSEHLPLRAALRVSAEPVPGPYDLVKLRVRVENTDGWQPLGAPREQALRRSLISAHLIIAVNAGTFVSLLDPPEWARPAVETCRNEHTWPVLVGEPGHRDVMLSSPIILYDHPDITPESPGPLFDSTEIDEMLHLRTLTLPGEKTPEARETDPRVAELIDMVGSMPPELLERLHGAIRSVEPVEPAEGAAEDGPTGHGPPGRRSAPEPTTDPAAEPATESTTQRSAAEGSARGPRHDRPLGDGEAGA
ncbi:hypothetical protein [Streptosporangium sp. NPDC002721]|uniref:hypothetical protein n=1 Tax=Streptosporangium sp. NPDC002721 TaxID=3366188 RepID=UPI0036BA2259